MTSYDAKMMKMYGGIKQVTGQGVEKSNEDIKIIYIILENIPNCYKIKCLVAKNKKLRSKLSYSMHIYM